MQRKMPTVFPSRAEIHNDGRLKKKLATSSYAVPESEGKNLVILLKSELEVLKGLAKGQHPSFRQGNARAAADEDRETRRKIADERKAKMQAYDEERRAQGQVMSIADIEKQVEREQQVSVARRKQDESLDEVKGMNQVMQYAKCVTVRDAQILEKKALAAEKAEEDRRLDMMMELERLKALRMYEEREAKRHEDQKKGAAVIRAQIEEREQERLRKIELRQQEQDAMLRYIDKMKGEDKEEGGRRKENSRRLMEDVALANAEQIRLKSKQQEMEIEEDARIAEYNREKERRDQEVADEQAQLKHEREMEVARLRSKQEKAQDKQAELDAIRARRAQEAHERENRRREQSERQRNAEINDDLARAREQQRFDREQLLAEQAYQEQEEFDRIIALQKKAEEQDAIKRQRDNELRTRNALDLQKQINEIEEQRRKKRRDELQTGQDAAAAMRDREATVDAIRAQKLTELESLQVPKQYRQELVKKRNTEKLRPVK